MTTSWLLMITRKCTILCLLSSPRVSRLYEVLKVRLIDYQQKLFMLIPGRPVGLLIYNNTEFMQLPWETIVKKYRNVICDKSFSTLQEYANDFLSFISNPGSGLFSDEEYNMTFRTIVYYYMHQIAYSIVGTVKQKFEDSAKRISRKEISDIISEWIDKYYQKWQEYDNQFSDEDTIAIKQDLIKYQGILEEVREDLFGQAQLSDNNKKKIEQFCYSLFYKNKVIDFYTAIVIAGFGENELYPVCVEYILEHYFCNHLKFNIKLEAKIDPKQTGWIIAFAQKDVVKNFMDGIHPDFEEQLRNELNKVFTTDCMVEITTAMKGLTQKRKKAMVDAFEKIKKDKLDTLLEKVQGQFKEVHTDSILATVSILPKDELAKMAESLVNITSFMRRVSMDVESVGGPIDVAVISKKDGFIWIRRKHYFDLVNNPHYKLYSVRGLP